MWPKKTKETAYNEPSELQKQLENSVSGTENAGLVWLSLSQQTISRQTQVGINKLPNYIHITLYKKSIEV